MGSKQSVQNRYVAVADIAVVSCANRNASLGKWVYIAYSCYPKVQWSGAEPRLDTTGADSRFWNGRGERGARILRRRRRL